MSLIGTDIEQVSRVQRIMTAAPRFKEKVFTQGERDYCDRQGCPARHYTARFCAKEAFAKALGVSLSWHDVEVLREAGGPPSLRVTGEGLRLLSGREVCLSISHAGDYAVAVVLVED